MSPFLFVQLALRPAMLLLPPQMDTLPARAMVLAACLQESELRSRVQIGAPHAHGYGQFEIAGVAGVLEHRASRAHAIRVCEQLDIVPAPSVVHRALEHHDVLTVVFARLLLWTLPDPLPDVHGADIGWQQYFRAWKPGRPRPHHWRGNFGVAWSTVTHDGHELPTGQPASSWGYVVPPPTGQ